MYRINKVESIAITLEEVGHIEIDKITAGDISEDGTKILLRKGRNGGKFNFIHFTISQVSFNFKEICVWPGHN